MIVKPFGDRAALVELEQIIAPDINDRVLALRSGLEAMRLPGITYFIPAYCSLTIGFDPAQISFDALKEQVQQLNVQKETTSAEAYRKHTIPVCYDSDFAPDMEAVTTQTGLSKEAVIDLHTSTTYRVYMMGFLPGFAYMGKTPEALFVNRKASPRLQVPELSVGLAGNQTGIYPTTAPGGWQLIGRTPVSLVQPPDTFLFKAGDRVQFKAISMEAFEQLLQSQEPLKVKKNG